MKKVKIKKKVKIATFEVKIRWEGGDNPKFGITGFVDLSEVKISVFSTFHLFTFFTSRQIAWRRERPTSAEVKKVKKVKRVKKVKIFGKR